jgi:hypothetical protein
VLVVNYGIAAQIREPELVASCRSKIYLFLAFAVIQAAYFGSELVLHMFWMPSDSLKSLSKYSKAGVDLGVHEATQFIMIALLLVIYRARN